MNERERKLKEELNRQIDEQKKTDHKRGMGAISQTRRKPTKFEPSPMHFPINVPILQAPEPISKPVPSTPVITVPEIQPSPEAPKPVPAKPFLSGRWDTSRPGYDNGAPRRPTPEEDRQFDYGPHGGNAMRYVGYTILEQSRRLPSSMTADDELGELLETKIGIKVSPGKVVFEMTDDGIEWKPIDITNTPLGRLLLAAEQEPNGATGTANTDRRIE